jgi:hypothetical protein
LEIARKEIVVPQQSSIFALDYRSKEPVSFDLARTKPVAAAGSEHEAEREQAAGS